MTHQISGLWQAIKLTPRKWSEQSHGRDGGRFWVAALVGESAIWYNDTEEGFNRSSYRYFGELDSYFCNQDELEVAVQDVLTFMETGIDTTPRCSAPVAGVYLPHSG